MADWSAPFHMPNMTDDVFDARRKAAIKKNGYKVRIPGLEDILHLPAEEPMTASEAQEWKKEGHGDIPLDRKDELARMKQMRKEKYDAMLRDPSPDIIRARSSIMASLDDAQDALSTIGVLGRLLLPLLPRAAAAVLGGPIGWILTGAMLLNVMNELMKGGVRSRSAKRRKNDLSKHNPFTQKGKAGIAKELARKGLHSGNLIEAAQVTDNIWGVGICLGPIMALPWTVGSGLVRQAMGQPVEWECTPTNWAHWRAVAGRALHSLPGFWGDSPFLSDKEILGVMFAGHFAQQAFPATESPCEGLMNVKNVNTLEMCAPTPQNLLTREVIREAGHDPDSSVEWPSTGQKWSTLNDLTDTVYPRAQAQLRDVYDRNSANLLGYYSGCYAGEAGLYAIENTGGSDSVKTSYTVASRAITGLMDLNWKLPDNIRPEQIERLGEHLDNLEAKGWEPGKIGIVRYTLAIARIECGFQFVQAT